MNKFLQKILAVLTPLAGAILGALGGADKSSKLYRRIGIPVLLVGQAYVTLENIYVLIIMTMCGWLSMGYGIPGNGDAGSALGRFWYKLFKQNHFLADIFTRGTIGVLIASSLVVIPILKHNWIVYFISSLFIVLVQALISWRNLGQYTLFKKQLNWSDTIVYFIITLCGSLTIKF
jgi:hypothetical protein